MKESRVYALVILLLLAVTIIFSLAACSKTATLKENDHSNISNEVPENTVAAPGNNDTEHFKKLDEEIEFASDYSEGLAFVRTKSNQQYFINQAGEIVIDLKGVSNLSTTNFVNGLAQIDKKGSVCDKSGKITTPESVGATYFYVDALAGGYLIAHIVDANYAGTINKLGVLNSDFQWLIEPTEENFKLLVDENSELPEMGKSSQNYFYKDFLYIFDLQQFLYLKDFTLHTEWEYDNVPETWICWSGSDSAQYTYIANDYSENPILELNQISNFCGSSKFVGDNAVAIFYNPSANQSFFTLIDAKGNFLFEPVKVFDGAIGSYIAFDGNYIALCGSDTYKVFDKNGKLMGEMTRQHSYSVPSIADGVFCVDNCYYNMDLTPLF